LSTPIDFYFDFSSPYGYFGAAMIEPIAARHGRTVRWHPILLGAVFKITGGAPFPTIPLKGEYANHDFARCARYYGLRFALPSKFPVATHNTARAFIWADDQNEPLAKQFALALYRAYFEEDVDISDTANVARIAASLGFDAKRLLAALSDLSLKERLRAQNEAAIARGVFGSPFFFVDGEPFWGSDRLPQIEKWLTEGGF
jgi:2-hydroxychromene-2-carboxylate isomerase